MLVIVYDRVLPGKIEVLTYTRVKEYLAMMVETLNCSIDSGQIVLREIGAADKVAEVEEGRQCLCNLFIYIVDDSRKVYLD